MNARVPILDDVEPEEDEELTEEEKAKLEKKYKAQRAVFKALHLILKEAEDGLPVNGELLSLLGTKGIKNFDPTKLGYDDLDDMLASAPEDLFSYEPPTGTEPGHVWTSSAGEVGSQSETSGLMPD